MALSGTQFATVTWTSGDIITETKKDNETANAQAYDSHAANGMLVNNDVGYWQKVAAGTNRQLINIDGSDVVEIGQDGENDHTVINAGTSKLVKIKVLRQDDTANAYKKNTVVLTGWGFIAGDGANREVSESVTFGITFSNRPVVRSGLIGTKSGSDPSHIGDLSSGSQVRAWPTAIATTGFTANIGRVSRDGADPGVLGAAVRNGYSWIALGQFD